LPGGQLGEPVGLAVVGVGVGVAVVFVGVGVLDLDVVGELVVCVDDAVVDVTVVAEVVVTVPPPPPPPPPCWLSAEVVLDDADADVLAEELALPLDDAVSSPKLDVAAVDGLPLTTDVVDVAAVLAVG
jgi:hypothetical protein